MRELRDTSQSPLHRMVDRHLQSFQAQIDAGDATLPRDVVRSLGASPCVATLLQVYHPRFAAVMRRTHGLEGCGDSSACDDPSVAD